MTTILFAIILWAVFGLYWYLQTRAAWTEEYEKLAIFIAGPLVWALEWYYRGSDDDS